MTLSGKALYGVQSGNVRVNGKLASLERYKRVMGFVPQVGRTNGIEINCTVMLFPLPLELCT